MGKGRDRTERDASLFAEGTRAVEEIHRRVSDLPFEILDDLGVMQRSLEEVKRIHDGAVAAIYETVRDVGHKVMRFPNPDSQASQKGA